MTKILSWMLALLMLVMPVLGGAEAAETPAAQEAAAAGTAATGLASGLMQQSYTLKYLLQGQELTVDESVEAGEVLQAILGQLAGSIPGLSSLNLTAEDAVAAVTELLNALKIRVTGQSTGHEAQGGFRVLIQDESVLDLTAAVDRSGVYAASDMLGGDIYRVTPPQGKQILNQLAQTLVDQGRLPQSLVDFLKNGYRAFRADPGAFLSSMIGEVNPAGLVTAISGLLSVEGPEQLTEKPEGLAIDPAYLMTVTIRREALANTLTELAKMLWNMPVVQKLAGAVPVNGAPMTEERLVSAFGRIPEALTDDIVIQYYLSENFQAAQYLSEMNVKKGEEVVPLRISIVTENLETGTTHLVWTVDAGKQEQEIVLTGEMAVIPKDDGGEIYYDVTGTLKQGETETTPVQESIHMIWTQLEAQRDVNAEILMRIQTNPETPATGITYGIAATEKDLGDHAEETMTMTVGMENAGTLATVHMDARTDLAEAYIITPDAKEPLSMSQEELNSVSQEMMMKLQMLPATLITKLPENAQKVVMLLLSGGQQ